MLGRIGVAQESDIAVRIFTPQFAQVATERFEVIAFPDRLQFSPLGDGDRAATANESLPLLVNGLPHTPYTAIGINFTWNTDPLASKTCAATRKVFFPPESILAKDYESPDARFGAYFSKDAFGARLKLTVLPQLPSKNDWEHEFVQLSFNLHLDLAPEAAVDQIIGLLGHWADAKQSCHAIAQKIENSL